MALIVTVGSADAQGFCTAEERDALIAAAPFDTSDWDEIDDDRKDALQALAPPAMDWMPLRGYRVYTGQALPFPRTHQIDKTVIPDEVKIAEAYITYLIAKPAMDKLSTEAASIGKAEVKSVSLEGLVSMTFASESLQKQGNYGQMSLSRLLLSRESPIWMAMSRGKHISRFRCFGATDRPTLLDAVS